jgi:hypothetical protein
MKTSQDNAEIFPYETFPIKLQVKEGKNTTVCFFQCDEHLQKHLERYKLDNKDIKIDYRDGEPTQPSQKRKRSVEQKPEPKSNRSTGSVRKRKPNVDSTGNTARTTKRKK